MSPVFSKTLPLWSGLWKKNGYWQTDPLPAGWEKFRMPSGECHVVNLGPLQKINSK